MTEYLLLGPVGSFILALGMYLIHAEQISDYLMGLTFVLWLAVAIWPGWFLRNKMSEKVTRGMVAVSLLLALFWDSMFVLSGENVGELWYRVLGTLCLNVSVFIWLISWLFKYVQAKHKLNHNAWVYLLFTVVIVVLSYETLDDWYRWDSYYYISQLGYAAIPDFTLKHLDSMNLVNHLCSVYSMLALTICNFIGEITLGARLLNWILALWSAICFFRLLYQAAFRDKKWYAVACTLVYIASPWMMGFIGEVSLDYVGFCAMPLLFWYLYDRNVVMTAFAASVLAFSKEPGVIVCGAAALTIWYEELSREYRPSGIKEWIVAGWRTVWNGRVIAIGIPLVIWLMQYVRLSHWGASDSTHFFGISTGFLKQKIPTMLTLNFTWLIVLLALLFGIRMKQKGREREIIPQWMLPLVTGTMGFLLFDLIFVTFNHGRYNLLLVPGFFVVLFYWMGKSGVIEKISGKVLLGLLGCLLFVQTFWQIDPVSKWIERDIPIGQGTIVSTNWNFAANDFGDSIVTNRQYTYFDEALDRMLEEIDYKEGKALVLPGCFNVFMGLEPEYIYYGIMGDYAFRNVDIYWDPVKKERNFVSGELLKIYVMTEDFASQKVEEELYYISVPWYEEDAELLQEFTRLDKEEISYRGWEITVYELGEKR